MIGHNCQPPSDEKIGVMYSSGASSTFVSFVSFCLSLKGLQKITKATK
jgi:hypothetical protein